MNIQKIIKYYFVFALILGSISSAFISDSISGELNKLKSSFDLALANVMAISDFKLEMELDNEFSNIDDFIDAKALNLELRKGDSYYNYNSKQIVAFNIFLKSQESLILNDLKLKINGIEEKFVKNLYIENADGTKTYAYFDKEGFVFNDIEYAVANGKNTEFKVFLELNEGLKVNTRFNFSIANKNDINLSTNSIRKYFKSAYPIETPYISIVGRL